MERRVAPRSVWVVDDSPLDLQAARAALQEFQLRTFEDGLAMLEALAAGEAPEVLVVDWTMPEVSGLDLIRSVRDQQQGEVPTSILMLTGRSATDEVVTALDAGADEHLAKPFEAVELKARVAALMRIHASSKEARAAERRFRLLFDSLPDAVLTLDGDARVVMVNAAAEALLGPREATGGLPLNRVLPDLAEVLAQAGRDGRQPLPDVAIGDRVVSPLLAPFPADEERTLVTLRDVTSARAASRRRLDLYAVIAHDLRGPLTAMMMRTQLIQRGRRGLVSAELMDDVRRIEDRIRSLVGLINDFLDLARLEDGGYLIPQDLVDVASLTETVVEDLRPMAEAAGIALAVDLSEAGAGQVSGDRDRLAQVLGNLVSNALKFTPAGGHVRIVVREEHDEVALEVVDDGPGIPEEEQPRIFNRYVRARSAGRVAGTGLGLMIVREIAEAHGGRVSVDSTPGVGSTFRVHLPRPGGLAHTRQTA